LVECDALPLGDELVGLLEELPELEFPEDEEWLLALFSAFLLFFCCFMLS
jgi:hypothetical protein